MKIKKYVYLVMCRGNYGEYVSAVCETEQRARRKCRKSKIKSESYSFYIKKWLLE